MSLSIFQRMQVMVNPNRILTDLNLLINASDDDIKFALSRGLNFDNFKIDESNIEIIPTIILELPEVIESIINDAVKSKNFSLIIDFLEKKVSDDSKERVISELLSKGDSGYEILERCINSDIVPENTKQQIITGLISKDEYIEYREKSYVQISDSKYLLEVLRKRPQDIGKISRKGVRLSNTDFKLEEIDTGEILSLIKKNSINMEDLPVELLGNDVISRYLVESNSEEFFKYAKSYININKYFLKNIDANLKYIHDYARESSGYISEDAEEKIKQSILKSQDFFYSGEDDFYFIQRDSDIIDSVIQRIKTPEQLALFSEETIDSLSESQKMRIADKIIEMGVVTNNWRIENLLTSDELIRKYIKQKSPRTLEKIEHYITLTRPINDFSESQDDGKYIITEISNEGTILSKDVYIRSLERNFKETVDKSTEYAETSFRKKYLEIDDARKIYEIYRANETELNEDNSEEFRKVSKVAEYGFANYSELTMCGYNPYLLRDRILAGEHRSTISWKAA